MTLTTKYQALDPKLETYSKIIYPKEENKLVTKIIMDKDTIVNKGRKPSGKVKFIGTIKIRI